MTLGIASQRVNIVMESPFEMIMKIRTFYQAAESWGEIT